MKKIFLIIIILVLSNLSCSDSTDLRTPNNDPAADRSATSLSGSAAAWPGLCQRIQVNLLDSNSSAITASENLSINVTSDFGALYSDSACTQISNSVTITAGSQNTAFYFKAAAGTSNLTASGDSVESSTMQITIARPSANLVLGQPNFNTNGANNGGVSGQSLYYPYNVFVSETRIFVLDSENHRVLIWNTASPSSGQTANIVLGQPDLTTANCNYPGVTAQTLCWPGYVHSDGQRLFVADNANSRVLIWNSIPTSSQQAADLVLGQPDMFSDTPNNGGIGAASLSYPQGVYSDGTRLVVCDSGNSRVLIWNTIPVSNQAAADIVVGQPDMTSNAASSTASGMVVPYPYMASVQAGRLFVNDFSNHRILIWNSIPTVSGQAANVAVGQPNLTSNTANNGGVSASSLRFPGDVRVDSQGRMIVADWNNSRILIWNGIPSSSGVAADAVIGQPGFTTRTPSEGGMNDRSLQGPAGVEIHQSELWVADYYDSRILRYQLP